MTVETERKGDYMQTFTGKKFWPFDPKPEDVCIADIAHALALENRYNGHTPFPYSVGQHSLHVADIIHRKNGSTVDQLYGLLHDASEAYIKDIVRALKRGLTGYKEIEENVMMVIFRHFGLSPVAARHMPDIVSQADEIALATERRDIFTAASHNKWTLRQPPDDVVLEEMDWNDVITKFLLQFSVLNERLKEERGQY